VKIAAGIAALYLIIVVLMALAQDRLLLPRWAMGSGVALPATAERLGLGQNPIKHLKKCDLSDSLPEK
jgi:hypothetical protein